MSDLRGRLVRLGLSQYYDTFAAEGFDTWDTVLDITESDLSHLNVKLGHRRKLQRAIAESRGQSSDRPLPPSGRATSVEGSYRSGEESGPESKARHGEPSTTTASGTTTKRKYRRHPKADEHAPERPPSAYVIFSNHTRELLKGQDLTFTEIAKVVGERWQVLPADERESCERQANSAKEKYYAELSEYKKTPEYEAYQRYLEDFKAKHAAPTKGKTMKRHFLEPRITGTEGKRSKVETETSGSTRSSSFDQTERGAGRLSGNHFEPLASAYQGEARVTWGSAIYPTLSHHIPKPTSPVAPSFSALKSPTTANPARSSMFHRDQSFESPAGILARDPRPFLDPNPPYNSSAYSKTPSSHMFPSTYQHQSTVDLPSRRSTRDPNRLPPLSHEDTTLSSESSHSVHSLSSVGMSGQMNSLNPTKSLRVLPQPVPSIGPSLTPMDRPQHGTSIAPLQRPPDVLRLQDPLAVLVKAGELAAREAEDDDDEAEISP